MPPTVIDFSISLARRAPSWNGSGSKDTAPFAPFQELKAGPIVGERTLGILVGPATGHSLIDGSGITVPGARLYDNAGHWFWGIVWLVITPGFWLGSGGLLGWICHILSAVQAHRQARRNDR